MKEGSGRALSQVQPRGAPELALLKLKMDFCEASERIRSSPADVRDSKGEGGTTSP